MALLEWGFGINKLLLSGLIIAPIFLTLSCTSTDDDKQVKNSDPQFEGLEQEDSKNSFFDDSLEANTETDKISAIHPKDNKPWTLKAMIMAGPKPPDEELIKCRHEILAISKETFNESGLMVAKEKILSDVNQDPSRYHWCFYFSMMTINTKLKSDGLGTGLKERLQNFHQEMKSVLVLASTLDQAYQSNRYVAYARNRYIVISKTYFARSLSPLPGTGKKKKPAQKKPAGHFE